MSSYNSISIEKLSRLIGTANTPTLIDVRIDEHFAADPRLIPGAVRRSHRDIQDWAGGLNGQSVVVICQKGENWPRELPPGFVTAMPPPKFSKAVISPGSKRSCRPFPPTRFRNGTGASERSG